MDIAFYLLIAAAAAGLLGVGIVLLIRGRSSRGAAPGSGRRRSRGARAALRREAARRLEQDERDWGARLTLADLAYEEGNHSEALQHYQALAPVAGTDPRVDSLLVNLRLGNCALKLGNPAEAYRAFLVARSVREKDFEVNYSLGLIEHARRRYSKAAGYLSIARAQNPDHVGANRCLGSSLYQLKMYPEAVRALEKALDFEPESRQTRYLLARAYLALNQSEPALEIFSRLRPDPELGAMACLYAGTIHARTRRPRQAIEDFALGLRHPNTAAAVTLELKYRLAAACLNDGQLGRSVRLWREIAEVAPTYKDVGQQLERYQEVHRNRNLQAFTMGASSEFVSLCRKLAGACFPGASVTLSSIHTHQGGHVDIQGFLRSPRAEEPIVFRFVRSDGVVGELALRELHARIKELRCQRGVCVCAGTFSAEALRFVEARRIEMVDRERLLGLLKRL